MITMIQLELKVLLKIGITKNLREPVILCNIKLDLYKTYLDLQDYHTLYNEFIITQVY